MLPRATIFNCLCIGMESSCMRRLLVCCAVLASLTSMAYAQGAATVRVLQTSVILDGPRGDSAVVISVPPGIVLDVLAHSGEWLEVNLENTPGAKRPYGWIHSQLDRK